MILAVVDLLVLYIRCGNKWINSIKEVDLTMLLMSYSQSLCKVLPFAFNFLLHLYAWLLVCSCVEVYIATSYPHKVPKMCTLERSKAIVLLLTVLLICVNVHYFWSLELISIKSHQNGYGEQFFCTFAKHGQILREEFTMSVWPVLDMMVADILPYTAVLLSTLLCVVNIIKNRKNTQLREESHQIWKSKFTLNANGIEQMKKVFISLFLLYILLTLPKLAILMYEFSNQDANYSDLYFMIKMALAKCIGSTLFYIFLSCKVFLYCALSKRFRKEALSIITCKRFFRKKPSYPHINYSNRPLLRTQAKNQLNHRSRQDGTATSENQAPRTNGSIRQLNNIQEYNNLVNMTEV